MAKMNVEIMKKGGVQGATKLPVVTIGLGKVADLRDLTIKVGDEDKKIIWHNEAGQVVIATKEHPEGDVYDQERPVVARVIGDKVLIGGLYDIYAPAPEKIGKLLSNPINITEHLAQEQLDQLAPLLVAASKIQPSLAPAEYGRKVVHITEEMVGEVGYVECVCTWHEKSGQTTKLYAGDVFLIEDEEKGHGYRIGAEEYRDTHADE